MRSSILEVFLIFLRLGLTSFGGPIAHLSYFRQEFVTRRKWTDEQGYADLVALCQFLPGPASSQVGIALGLSRGGVRGAMAAWLGFTLPSALVLTLFGFGLSFFGNALGEAWLHGFKVFAVAVVAQAIGGMARTLCPDVPRVFIALVAAILASLVPSASGQITAIALGGCAGRMFLRTEKPLPQSSMPAGIGRKVGGVALSLFFLLLAVLPIIAEASQNFFVRLTDSFYRAGALVFGGGHVVLPLLKAEVVQKGWVSNDAFLAGYGAAQAIPGPLFTFAAYLGSVATRPPAQVLGAALALVAIFLPSFLLIVGTLPFWERLRQYQAMQSALLGINAAVVGLLLAAFYNPVWMTAIFGLKDFAVAIIAFLLLESGKLPPWLLIILCALTITIFQ
jgi:chromate transporter